MATRTEHRPTLEDLQAQQAEWDAKHPRKLEPLGSYPTTDAEIVAATRQAVANGMAMELRGLYDVYMRGASDWRERASRLSAYHQAADRLIDIQIAEEQRLYAERNRPRSERELIDDEANRWLQENARHSRATEKQIRSEVVPLLQKRARLIRAAHPRKSQLESVEGELADFGLLPPTWEAETAALS